jgi:hypothetical protein
VGVIGALISMYRSTHVRSSEKYKLTYSCVEIGLFPIHVFLYLILIWQQGEPAPIKELVYVFPDYETMHETLNGWGGDMALTTDDIKMSIDIQGSQTKPPRKF